MKPLSNRTEPKRLADRWHRMKQRLSTQRWFTRFFDEPCVDNRSETPGLLMIKIDGLSHRQLQVALERRRLPYIERLIASGDYQLKHFYSGIPSATPAVQGELFYGVPSSVPSIAFIDREHNKKYIMLYPGSVGPMAESLERQGRPLLAGGTSYSNIYTGGAEEARYCIQTMRLRSLRHLASSVKLVLHFLVRPFKLLRMLGYGVLEAAIAVYDFIRGTTKGKNIFKEMKFIPTRVLVCILLRELIRTRVKMDLSKGRRIVHASFLGYDEQSHRRGPDSAFAHWTLKGIDAAVADMHRAAKNSKCRPYRLVVYADHGQQAVIPYSKRYEKTPEDAIEKVISRMEADSIQVERRPDRHRITAGRSRRFLRQGVSGKKNHAPAAFSESKIRITTMGPLGHVYLQRPIPPDRKAVLANALVAEAGIPLVFYLHNDIPVAINPQGRFELMENASRVLGRDHPFPDRTAEDLARVCRHPNAGDLLISGWIPQGRPLTFAVENGAHGGPGSEETAAFIVLPRPNGKTKAVLRPMDLRRYVFDVLDRHPGQTPTGIRE